MRVLAAVTAIACIGYLVLDWKYHRLVPKKESTPMSTDPVTNGDKPVSPTPGYMTTEFWNTTLAQVIAVLVHGGFLTQVTADSVTSQVGAIVSGVAAVLVLWKMGTNYANSRTALKVAMVAAANGKEKTVNAPVKLELLPMPKSKAIPLGPAVVSSMVIAAMFMMPADVTAQVCPPKQTHPTALLPWRSNVEELLRQIANQRQCPPAPAPQDNSALLLMGQQLAAMQSSMNAMLAKQATPPCLPCPCPQVQQNGPPAITPQVAPIHYIYPQQQPVTPHIINLTPPYQQIPLGDKPYQQIPLGDAPYQQLPLGVKPYQTIPIGGQPHQIVPLGGGGYQAIPLGQPVQPIQPPPVIANPAPVIPAAPGVIKPAPVPPGPMPPANGSAPAPGPSQVIPLGPPVGPPASPPPPPVSYQKFSPAATQEYVVVRNGVAVGKMFKDGYYRPLITVDGRTYWGQPTQPPN